MAASTSTNSRFRGLAVMSFSSGMYPAAGSTSRTPADSRILKHRPSLVGSLGTAILSPSFNSLTWVILSEYRDRGATMVSPRMETS